MRITWKLNRYSTARVSKRQNHRSAAQQSRAVLRPSCVLRFSRAANGNSTVPSARVKITIAQRAGAKAGNKLRDAAQREERHGSRVQKTANGQSPRRGPG